MATIQERNGSFRVLFCYEDKRLSFTAGRVTRTQAEAHAEKVDELLALLADGTVSLPNGIDIATFMLFKGKPPAPSTKPVGPGTAGATTPDEPLRLSAFKAKYLEARSAGSMEQNSLATARMHLGHFERTLGSNFDLRKLTLADLQSYITRRRKEGDPRRKNGARNATSAATLRLEISSLRSAWNWAARNGMVSGPFPSKGLEYPKADEQPPFMTRQEVERRIQFGGEAAELWDCLYLRKEEIVDLLVHVKEKATAPWLHPMIATAAYTGARRSELLRMETADIDFEGGVVVVREKKRSRKQRTTRRVALTPALAAVLKEWLAAHPGGKFLFCQVGVVARSKKRSRTTGHKGETTRASSLKGRMAAVRKRDEQAAAAVTRDEAHDHLKRTLAGSKWEVLRGYHVLRHSFISCRAVAGVDQRIIDDFVGHCSEEQRRRYRHLLPDVKQKAIIGVFG